MTLPTYSADVSSKPTATFAQRLQGKTTAWPLVGKIAWWVLLLPLALTLVSWARPPGWSRRIGLSAAAVIALFGVVSAVTDPPATQPNVASLASTAGQKSEIAGLARQAAADKAAADAASAQAAVDRKAVEDLAAKTAAGKAAADRAAADKAAAEKAKAAADRAAADKAAAEKAAADRAAADKAAADKAAADKAAADKQAAQSSNQQQATTASAPTGNSYANCTELRQDYPGGVARPGAVDHRSNGGHATYRPYYSSELYEENSEKDRDGDGIACEA